MNIQQLRCLLAVVQSNLNITAAAGRLYTSQPGVSKQIRLLEDELGIQIFERTGKQLTGVSPVGKAVIKQAERILGNIDSIPQLVHEHTNPHEGELSIATTHTQARYVLPSVVRKFSGHNSHVKLHLHQGNPEQIASLAASGVVDFAIATEAMEYFEDLVMIPCYRWNRAIITPCDHPLTEEDPLTLEEIAQYRILTYVYGFTGRSKLDKAFREHKLTANVIFTATDADVIKTYVRLGLGVGIVAKMAYDRKIDTDLCALDASHLFESSISSIGFRRSLFLRDYHYNFMSLFYPHLTSDLINAAIKASSNEEREQLFNI